MIEGSTTATYRHDGLLGTSVEVRVAGADPRACDTVDGAVVAEIERLTAIFSVYDGDSELSRWKRGELEEQSSDFVEVMASALHWQRRSGGAFNPMVGVISAAWQHAAAAGTRPDRAELERLAATIVEPRFEVTDGVVVPLDDCSSLNLNAIAKGYIVDRATFRAMISLNPSMLLVSAGGDLLHRGTPPARIGIENPLRPFDNEPPLAVIELADVAVATSGGARRRFRVGGDTFSHVIDPRTGEPSAAQASVSVVAADAMTADVVATVLGMAEPGAAVAEADDLTDVDVACLVVGNDGRLWPSEGWSARFGGPGRHDA